MLDERLSIFMGLVGSGQRRSSQFASFLVFGAVRLAQTPNLTLISRSGCCLCSVVWFA